jgi:hypothetical protein
MPQRLRAVLAALLGPLVVFLLIAAWWHYYNSYSYYYNSYVPMNVVSVLAAYALAHVLFWPPALATNFIGRQLGFKSLLKFVILMGALSALLSILLDGVGVVLHFDVGGWQSIARNAGNLALAGAGAYILYRVVLDYGSVAPTPNNRWRGP